MRWLLWILGLAAAATGLVLLGEFTSGYVLVALPGRRIELSLNLALLLVAGSFVVLYLLLRFVFAAIELPARVAGLRAARRREAGHEALLEALREFFAGRYARAEKNAERATDLGVAPDVAALVAANSAHGLRARDRRDAHLDRAQPDAAGRSPATVISRARMLLDDRRPEDALAALAMLPVRHTAALRLELRARQRLGQWEQVPALIDQLEKRRVFGAGQADIERRHAWRQLIQRHAGDAAALTAVWRGIPDRHRREAAVAAAAAAAFAGLGRFAEAQTAIEQGLEQEWDGSLVHQYGDCAGADVLHRIERAERWLKDHRNDGALLLALGRLCATQQLWGKAQSYLEASIAVEPTHTAHLELARLHEKLGRAEAAARHYRASLDQALSQLGRATGGRRRRPV